MNKLLIVTILLLSFLFCSCSTAQTLSTTDAEQNTVQTTEDTTATDSEPSSEPSAPEPTEPAPTEPTPTEPAPTEPAPSEPDISFPEIEYSESGYLPKALMYHLVLEEPYNYNVGLFVRPSDLEAQIEALLDAGYVFLFADEYGKTKEKSVVLTFDDGYTDNCTELLPILKKYNVKATVYIIGDLVGNHHEYLTYDQIREMADSGLVQFGCHTMSHPDLTTLTDEQIREEYQRCKDLIKSLTDQDCRSIAYPYGYYDARVTAITKEYFDYAYNSGYYAPAEDDINYYIARYYVKRGITGQGLMDMLGY